MRKCLKCSCSIENKHKNALFCTIECKNSYWQQNNKDKANKTAEKFRNSEKGILYRTENKDKINEQVKKWKLDNLDRKKHIDKSYHEKMKGDKEYLAKRKHHEAMRRATKLNATLSGYDNEIKEIYKACPRGHHVDHIVPLQGETVSGLHVPWNLRSIPAEENLKKSNKLLENIDG